ncbi:MAG: SanA/YdcF family protein [Planctomycetota bacterium]
MRHPRLAAVAIVLMPVLGGCLLLMVDRHMSSTAAPRLFDDVAQVPQRPVALVLGTARHCDGRPNRFYEHRLDAAAELWHAGRVAAILVSGDNGRIGYDEPSDMRRDLIERGVAADCITRDFAGFRTLDSIVRAERVFGLRDYVIVSQRFHCERAIWVARQLGQDVVGYAASDVGGAWHARVRAREVLARAAAWLDVVVFDREPRYLGPQEPVVGLCR